MDLKLRLSSLSCLKTLIYISIIIIKIFIEFVTTLLLFYVFDFFGLRAIPTRDPTHTLCVGRQSLNHYDGQGSPYKVSFN